MNATTTQVPKKKWQFPTAYTVLFVVLLLAAALTYILPSGKYAKLSYSGDDKSFVITAPKGDTEMLPGTQETLEKLGVKIDLEQFTNKSIDEPIAIPNTYESLPAHPSSFYDFASSSIKGFYDTKDIALFILILGGIIGILNVNGSINAGFAALSRKTQGNEYVLVVLVTCLISAGGTTYGMAEETIALYPIIIPIFLVAGYDALVGIAAIYLGSCIGTMFSTVNVFATGIASAAAGTTPSEGMVFRAVGLLIGTLIVLAYILRYASKVKRDPMSSLVYEQRDEINAAFRKNQNNDVPAFTAARAIMLTIFMASFGVMMWGVIEKEWWFEEMSVLFLVSAFLIIVITIFFTELDEKETVNSFISGAADLVGVALILGLARAVNFLLDEGLVSDTILYNATQLVSGMNPILFIIVMMLIFIILGFFIPSSSGLAVLSMPIMAPLADTIGLPRDTIVTAYQYGLGVMAFVTPTGLILVVLSMSHITFDKWLKFVMPLLGILFVLALGMLVAQVSMA
ncbi:MAG: YfcC family protein [Gammaproteobacteria bacterium]|nr:YfcC family protein [Gammaproteobacteria bacterium]